MSAPYFSDQELGELLRVEEQIDETLGVALLLL